jgi:hypothetical protein
MLPFILHFIIITINYNIRNEDSSVALLKAMQITTADVGQKSKCSVLPDQKTMPLKCRWLQLKKEESVDKHSLNSSTGIVHNAIFLDSVGYYRVMLLHTKSYNKWRLEELVGLEKKVKFKAHIHRITYLHHCLHETSTR